MARKVFLSFLGVSNYMSCVYCYESRSSKVVTYVQAAIINMLAADFDEYIIFCTESAASKHFDALKNESSKNLKKVMIPDGISEAEIWEIFQILYNQLLEGDEVIYDVTNSFRSLPMLGIVLLQYAKFLKKIKVQGIYYGAFERLGNMSDVEKNYPDPTERQVPLLNLTAFSSLQDWTIAANNFIELGNADKVHELALQGITPILSQTNGKDGVARDIRQIAKSLQSISLDFRTNRGKDIYSFSKGASIISLIERIEKSEFVPPFKPIVHNIKGSILKFRKGNINNLFYGVEWCINKGLIQEGITQLQEGIISFLCFKLSLDFEAEPNRNLISSYLTVRFHKTKCEWEGELKKEENGIYIEKLDELLNMKELSGVYNGLTQKRNDINHGGFTKDTPANDFIKVLKKNFNEVKIHLSPNGNDGH